MTALRSLPASPETARRPLPRALVVTLYDRAIVALQRAVAAIARHDVDERDHAIAEATDIVGHLYLSVDLAGGGQAANYMSQLYSFILSKLPRISRENDARPGVQAIRLLDSLRRLWRDFDNRIGRLSTLLPRGAPGDFPRLVPTWPTADATDGEGLIVRGA